VGAEDARAIAVYPHTELHPWPSIIALARTSRIVIVDSLSSIEKRDPVPHMTQVRTLAPHCVLIYIVQMDKEHATYAGPAALEHAVDCSIILRQHNIHTRKNRKGPAPIQTKRTTPPHGR
jgi:predicted ATP-dependent serine protease